MKRSLVVLEPIFLVAILVALIVFQQFFYMRSIQKLLNRLMSKNFSDYAYNELRLEKAEEPKPQQAVQTVDRDNDDIEQLNQIFSL